MRSKGRESKKTEVAGESDRRRRYQPRAIYEMVEALRQQGIDLATRSGPWRAVASQLSRPGRLGLSVLPIVTNGLAQIMVDTMEHACEVAGLLNWSGVDDLDPVSDLVPPSTLQYGSA